MICTALQKPMDWAELHRIFQMITEHSRRLGYKFVITGTSGAEQVRSQVRRARLADDFITESIGREPDGDRGRAVGRARNDQGHIGPQGA